MAKFPLAMVIQRRDSLFDELGARYRRFAANNAAGKDTTEEGEEYFRVQAEYEALTEQIQIRLAAGERVGG